MIDKILIVGTDEIPHVGRSFRIAAEEFGTQTIIHDETEAFAEADSSYRGRAMFKLRRGKPSRWKEFNRELLKKIERTNPDVTLVVKGSYIAPETLKRAKEDTKTILINYSTDNPFNRMTSNRNIVESIPYYDIYFSARKSAIPAIMEHGAKRAEFILFGYDPTIHFPEETCNEEEEKKYSCDVSFVGVCGKEREGILLELLRRFNGTIKLYGGHYDNKVLREHWGGFVYGREYRLALRYSKISLCLVRKANMDDHVMRTFEIPACQTFMAAEGTDIHKLLFTDGKDAALFDSSEELIEKLHYFMKNDDERRSIGYRGWEEITSGGNTYLDRLKEMIAIVEGK